MTITPIERGDVLSPGLLVRHAAQAGAPSERHRKIVSNHI
jgi:hypothetical protein